ncbi:MAG: type III-B CRISPR module RAMP protein Cmr4 [Acidobacteriia bacterium]|nr:type III-B CRISPR module RAMP protein Cmr4 [Terriglobia bacterium]
MANNTRLYWLHALTPLHVGAGRGLGYIDLPIMREKVTNWPLVPGSTVKGVIADHHNATEKKRLDDHLYRAAFGIADPGERSEGGSNSGSLVFTDARLVCLPVRSLYGTFAWCSSPMALRRLYRDIEAAGKEDEELQAPIDPADDHVHLPLVAGSELTDGQDRVFFEDLDFRARDCPVTKAWSSKLSQWLFTDADWQKIFEARFAVVPDNVFNFLCETGTEVAARVRINEETKTVKSGALWYEEALPAESILCGLVWCDRVFGSNGGQIPAPIDLLDRFCSTVEKPPLQIGGKATVGRGQVRCVFCA